MSVEALPDYKPCKNYLFPTLVVKSVVKASFKIHSMVTLWTSGPIPSRAAKATSGAFVSEATSGLDAVASCKAKFAGAKAPALQRT